MKAIKYLLTLAAVTGIANAATTISVNFAHSGAANQVMGAGTSAGRSGYAAC